MKNFKDILSLNSYLLGHWSGSLQSLLFGLLSNISGMATALYASYISILAFSHKEIGQILDNLPILLILVLMKGIFAYLHMYVCHDMAYKILKDIRMDLYKAIINYSPLTEREYRTGELGSIVMQDVELLETFYAHIIVDYLIAILSALIYLGFLAQYSLILALICLIISISILIVPYIFASINSERGKVIRAEIGYGGADMIDSIQGLEEIVIFGREERYIEKIKDNTRKIASLEVKDARFKGGQQVILTILNFAGLIVILLALNKWTLEGKINFTMVPILVVFSLNIFMPLLLVSNTAERIHLIGAAAKRIKDLLNKPSALGPSLKNQQTLKSGSKEYLIEIKDLYFSYEKGNDILKGLNLSIKKGENLAITGKSGAGKSTLAYLLLYFYRADKGDIYLQGQNYKNLSPQAVREMVSYVPQNLILFRGTILDNLVLGRPEASMDEVIEACKIAMCHDFIMEIPGGYGAFVEERGLNLSGGQRQRLGIARALIADGEILLMDEAVSNLDQENEFLFRQALRKLKGEKTLITIAHRKSTLDEVDRVVVIEDGRIKNN